MIDLMIDFMIGGWIDLWIDRLMDGWIYLFDNWRWINFAKPVHLGHWKKELYMFCFLNKIVLKKKLKV